jgi:hypothetical protein
VPGLDGQVVDPDGVDDDPQDREEPEGRALGGAEQRLVDRHRVEGDRDQQGDEQRHQPGDPRLDPQRAQQDEQGQQRQDGTEGRQPQGVADGIQYLFEHGLTSL